MKWFVFISVVLAAVFIGIIAHEAFHAVNGYESSVCFGTKLMQGDNQVFMNSPGFYVYSNSPVEHISRNETIAWSIQLVVTAALVFLGHLKGVWI